MATICPYCNIEVSESSIEAEDGCCPECGSLISVSSYLGGDDDDDGDIYDADDENYAGLDDDEDDTDYVDDDAFDELFDDAEEGFEEDFDFDNFDDDDDKF